MAWRTRVEAMAVCFTRENNKTYFLLVRKHNGWRIPKGGVEEGESFEKTIKRELWEEVGIESDKIHVLQKFNEYMYEDPRAGILHNPHVYLVYIDGKIEPRPDYEEISAAKWVTFSVAIKMLRFEEEKRILKQAIDLIKRISLSALKDQEVKEH